MAHKMNYTFSSPISSRSPTVTLSSPSFSVKESVIEADCHPILVFDGLVKYCERLKAHVAIYHHKNCHCFELIVFRQNDRNTVWARFYIKDSSINQHITPSKLKSAVQGKIRKRLLCARTSKQCKVSTKYTNVLAMYSLAQEFFESRMKDIVNFEISRLYLSHQAFSHQLLTDPFGRPVQGRDYSPFVIKLLVSKPDKLNPMVVCQDVTPPINRFLQRVKLSNTSHDSSDEYSAQSNSHSHSPDSSLLRNHVSSPEIPLTSTLSSLSCRQASPHIASKSYQLHRQSSQNSVLSALSANTSTKDQLLPRVVHFGDHPRNEEDDTHSVQSLPSMGPSVDELSISKFAASFVMSEYEALPPRCSPSRPTLRFDDNLENDDAIESIGIVVEPTVELLSLEPKGVSSRSLAQLIPQELLLNYDFLQEKSKIDRAKHVALEPIFRKGTSPFRCSTAIPSTSSSSPSSPSLDALAVRSCLNISRDMSLASRSITTPTRGTVSLIRPVKDINQQNQQILMSTCSPIPSAGNYVSNSRIRTGSPLRHPKKH